jgi:glycerophosphoryl diester phosphodiesterase
MTDAGSTHGTGPDEPEPELSWANLSATYAPRVNLVDELVGPFYIGHRGGHLRYPEHSLEGYRASFRDGFLIEPDIRQTSDGRLVCLHDDTVDRTMTGTGSISATTLAAWRGMRVEPQLPGGHEALPVEWLRVLNEFGGRALLIPEVKDPAARQPLIDSLAARGLQRAVIVQSFAYDDVQAVAAAGVAACLLSDSADPGTLVADGIEFLSCSTEAPAAYIAAAKAAGLRVIVYTVDTVAQATISLANGADGLFSDDPQHVTGWRLKRHADPFAEKVLWAGADPDPALWRFARAAEIGADIPAGSAQSIGHYWAGRRGPNVRVRWTVRYSPSANTDLSSWGPSMYVGTNPDADTEFTDAPGGNQNGYHGFIRRNGQLDLYRVTDGSATSIGRLAGSGPSVAATDEGVPITLELTINATGVTLKNLTARNQVTSADTTHRPANAHLTSRVNGTHGYMSSVTVDDL